MLTLCVGLYIFGALTGLGEMASVCLNAHLLIDKLQLYRYDLPMAYMSTSILRQSAHRCVQLS